MKDLINNILNIAKIKRVRYTDIRIIRRKTEEIEVKNGNVEALIENEDYGFGIRVLVNNGWGFACSSKINKREMETVFNKAFKIAKASSKINRENIFLQPIKPETEKYKTEFYIDPFTISLERKLNLLFRCDEIIRRNNKIKISEGFLASYKTEKIFASTDGSYIEQEIVECGAGISATAIEGEDVQVRSYPNSFGGNFATKGYEWIESLNLQNNAERISEEATQLLLAKPCPSKITTLILDGSQLALQIHESIGHAIELDRILGTEISYAGSSFIRPEMVGNFKYASDIVNVVADATYPGGLGSFGYDDEGVKAKRVQIISNGILVNLLTSRETAHNIGRESNGTMRADGWNRIPLIRMTNINLEPGDWSLEGMIEDTDEGVFLCTNRSWSIDDKRINFQFGTEIGWEIKDGRLVDMIKNPTYTGITPKFWNSCDAIAGRDYWQMWGILNCGKGEPGQVAHVGHGAAPARFRNVQIGVMKR
jgi:TldD protein